ncbi:MAG: hypothetical protein WC840_06910 [Candidatus Peribacteraceae bacterium]
MSKPSPLEEALFLSLGAAATARERLTDFIDYLIKEGKTTTTDRRKLQKQLETKGRKEYRKMRQVYEQSVQSALRTMGIPTRKEFEALRREMTTSKTRRRSAKGRAH